MKRWLIIATIVIGLPIISFALYLTAFFTVPPSFSASAQKLSNGDYRIEIDPNFVVHSIYAVEVSDSGRVLAQRDESINGAQSIIVPGPLPANTIVTVTCFLVYDRPMPAATTHTESVQLP